MPNPENKVSHDQLMIYKYKVTSWSWPSFFIVSSSVLNWFDMVNGPV